MKEYKRGLVKGVLMTLLRKIEDRSTCRSTGRHGGRQQQTADSREQMSLGKDEVMVHMEGRFTCRSAGRHGGREQQTTGSRQRREQMALCRD
jgi:hypothetical protein